MGIFIQNRKHVVQGVETDIGRSRVQVGIVDSMRADDRRFSRMPGTLDVLETNGGMKSRICCLGAFKAGGTDIHYLEKRLGLT